MMGYLVWVVVPFAACAGAHYCAPRKGQSSAWGFAALVFPPCLLLLELTPTRAGAARGDSNIVLEWVASLVVLAGIVALLVGSL